MILESGSSSSSYSWEQLDTFASYSERLLKQKGGGATCCVDVTNKHLKKREEREQDASLALSVRDLFLHVRVEPPQKAVNPPRKGDEEHFNTRHLTLVSDVSSSSEDESQTPSHSSQSFWGVFKIFFQNQCVGSFVRTASCV